MNDAAILALLRSPVEPEPTPRVEPEVPRHQRIAENALMLLVLPLIAALAIGGGLYLVVAALHALALYF